MDKSGREFFEGPDFFLRARTIFPNRDYFFTVKVVLFYSREIFVVENFFTVEDFFTVEIFTARFFLLSRIFLQSRIFLLSRIFFTVMAL